jgi:hypothetical protein
MAEYPAKEEYVAQLKKDIDEEIYRVYDAEEDLNDARKRFENAERDLTNHQSHANELKKLYFYATGKECNEWED